MTESRPVVCQLLHGLRVGGAEVLVARMARKLRERFHFHFACLDELGSLGEELQREGFAVEVLNRRPGIDWRLPWRLSRLLRRTHTSLIHAHQYTPFFYALTARFLRGTPILFTEHGRWVPDYPRPKRIVANRLLMRRCDRVIGVGEVVRQALIVNEGISAGRVGVIYNGVDLSPYRAQVGRISNPASVRPDWKSGPRSTVRREMNVEDDAFVIMQVARLVPIKDHQTALKALHSVNHPRARLVIVGEGPEESAIRETVARLGLQDRVRLLGLRSDVSRLLQAADGFLLSSINEGIPLTVIEAMAAGLPVVSTSAGGVGEVVLDGQTGLLAPVGDAEGLARHLLRLASDEAERKRMGEAGRQRAFTLFDEEQMLASYERLYREMLR
jgi:glycosyltransferase involved in cell wall biosynthesis